MQLNTLYNDNCLQTIERMPDNFIDLVVTSPPYDDARDYHGYVFDAAKVLQSLYRVIKPSGSVVWVVGDVTVNGCESGSSFRQALSAMAAGFCLHDTMIYEKNSSSFPARRNGNRYTQIFEYMFIFSKGRPKCHLICDKPNKWAGFTNWGSNTQYNKAGDLIQTSDIKPVPDFSPRNNIWRYTVGFNPAVFPEKLAEDHILSWSEKGDTVYDPFSGSGTTAKMAAIHGRNFVGSEISKEYNDIAVQRVNNVSVIPERYRDRFI